MYIQTGAERASTTTQRRAPAEWITHVAQVSADREKSLISYCTEGFRLRVRYISWCHMATDVPGAPGKGQPYGRARQYARRYGRRVIINRKVGLRQNGHGGLIWISACSGDCDINPWCSIAFDVFYPAITELYSSLLLCSTCRYIVDLCHMYTYKYSIHLSLLRRSNQSIKTKK